jgi:16S rRNA (cytosine967-C5)-methyltransferase
LTRAGADNIQRLLIRDEHDVSLKKLAGIADAVLVDAPCSGTGTLRRNPDIKWRSVDLDFLMQQQASILEAASRLVKPGGRMVYGTCSLLDQENAGITAAFLNSHPEFQAIPAVEIFRRQEIDIGDGYMPDGGMRLLPHRHGTDGFYALTMQRRASV